MKNSMFLLVISVLILNHKLYAGESLFGYLATTDLVPEGKLELEQWITDREGQSRGEFHHVDMSTEIEYGMSENLQLAVYLNSMYAREKNNSMRGRTEGMEIPFNHDSSKPYNEARLKDCR